MGKTIASFGSSFLSTPHGTLGTQKEISSYGCGLFQLSTPHGTLGTLSNAFSINMLPPPFNSTRYIRNPICLNTL